MLDQYIMEQLENNDEEFYRLSEQLTKLQMEEESCNDIIEKILKEDDVGIEFFSQRKSENCTL